MTSYSAEKEFYIYDARTGQTIILGTDREEADREIQRRHCDKGWKFGERWKLTPTTNQPEKDKS